MRRTFLACVVLLCGCDFGIVSDWLAAETTSPENGNGRLDGDRLLKLGRFEEAITAYDAVLEQGYSATALASRGYARLALGQRDEASQDIQKAVEIDPACPLALCYRAALAMLRRDFQAADADLKQALSLDPQLVWGHAIQGALLTTTALTLPLNECVDQLRLADTDFRRALEIDPEMLPARFGRAFAYRVLAELLSVAAGQDAGERPTPLRSESRALLTQALAELDEVERANARFPELHQLRATVKLRLYDKDPRRCIPDCAAALKNDRTGRRPYLKMLIQVTYFPEVQQDPALLATVEEALASVGPEGAEEFDCTYREVGQVAQFGLERLRELHGRLIAEGRSETDVEAIEEGIALGEANIRRADTLCQSVRKRLVAQTAR